MISLHDRDLIESVFSAPLPSWLANALADRIKRTLAAGLGDFTNILVVEAEDTEDQIVEAIGFSPLNDPFGGTRYGHPGFLPGWAWLVTLPSAFEMIVTVGDSGFAYVLLIEDAPADRSGLAIM